MGSIAAKEVGKEVLETVRKGKRPILGKIILKKGYAKTTSTVPTQVTRTKSYREVIDPALDMMITERQRALRELKRKKLNKVQYEKLADVIDKLTKNIQLLSGGRTGGETFVINIGKTLDELDE